METDTSIHNRAILVSLNIRVWSARKYDRGLTQKVNDQYAKTGNAGRYNKFLIPGDSGNYKILVSMAGSIRNEHYARTLSWDDEGDRLLPLSQWFEYMEWFRSAKSRWDEAVDAFVSEYPQAKGLAKTLLGDGLYREEDYPAVETLRGRFSLQFDTKPVPVMTGDIRLDLAADQVEIIKQSVVDSVNRKVEHALGDAWKRLYEVTAKIAERLKDPETIFRDSMVENAREVCAALRGLNFSGSETLEAMRLEVEQKLTKVDADVLRDSIQTRSRVATEADELMHRMQEYGYAR